MMTKDNSKVIKEKIFEARTKINEVRYYLPEYEVYGLTIKGKLFEQDLDGEESIEIAMRLKKHIKS